MPANGTWRAVAVAMLCAWGSGTALGAQGPGDGASVDGITLAQILTDMHFNTRQVGPLRWLAGGAAYTTLERSDSSGGVQIVRYDAATGARSVMVPARALMAPGGQPLVFTDYAWSPDSNQLLVFTNSQRVWRDNTRGDYWVLNRTTGALKKLGGPDAAPSSLMFAKFSPDGKRVAYVRDHDLWVEPVDGGAPLRLTNDGSSTIINGTSDWAYEEEFRERDCFRWSPDGMRIAYLQFDISGVRDFLLIDDTDSLYSFVKPVQYPKAGTTNSAVRAGVVPSTGGAPVWLDVPGDPRNNYIPRIEWAPTSASVVLQRVNRLQDTDQVMVADAQTGAAHAILRETDSAWVDVHDLSWVDRGQAFLWQSERDGWRHLYRVSADGHDVQLVTPGAFDVIAVAGVVDPWVYFIASPTNATQRFLYRARIDGKGKMERISPADARGVHNYIIAPNGRWAVHMASTADSPPVTDVVTLPEHRVLRTLEENSALRTAVAPLMSHPTEFFQVAVGGGVTLDADMIKPRDFDSTRTYPVLVYVYGEPAGQVVLDGWGGRGTTLWHRWIADHGYLVVSFDNRGTPTPKGRAWRKAVYKNIGPLSSREQADAVHALARQRSYVDTSRVAIWGWSGGGSSTLQAMFRYPEVYKVGMAVAPVPDERLYDTIYQERYMGLPGASGDAYDRSSPIGAAEGLRGSLLIVHGSGDDNVHYQGTERLVNRLVALGKPFDLMVYPNRTHGIYEGEGTTVHLYSLLARYLTAHLESGPHQRPAT
jgi:dipeptidyl-peptidase-4